jgi:hypothetical protein
MSKVYEFTNNSGTDLDRGRALVCLAFALRSIDSLPQTSEWALSVIGLSQLPRDIKGAANNLRRPDYSRNITHHVPFHELLSPLVSGMRFILDPFRTRASAAEHSRITGALRYTLPVIERDLPSHLPEFRKFCDYYQL